MNENYWWFPSHANSEGLPDVLVFNGHFHNTWSKFYMVSARLCCCVFVDVNNN